MSPRLGSQRQLCIKTHRQKQGGPGSVRFGYGLGVEGFERFRFSVLAVPLQKGFFCVSAQFNREGRFRFRFRFLENGSGGSGSLTLQFLLFSISLLLSFSDFPCLCCAFFLCFPRILRVPRRESPLFFSKIARVGGSGFRFRFREKRFRRFRFPVPVRFLSLPAERASQFLMLARGVSAASSGQNGSHPQRKDAKMTIKIIFERSSQKGVAKGAGGKGPRQKSSKSFSTLFDNFRAGQKTSKSVKEFFDTFRQFSRGTIFPALFGGSES